MRHRPDVIAVLHLLVRIAAHLVDDVLGQAFLAGSRCEKAAAIVLAQNYNLCPLYPSDAADE